jgi:hypothetical protein
MCQSAAFLYTRWFRVNGQALHVERCTSLTRRISSYSAFCSNLLMHYPLYVICDVTKGFPPIIRLGLLSAAHQASSEG